MKTITPPILLPPAREATAASPFDPHPPKVPHARTNHSENQPPQSIDTITRSSHTHAMRRPHLISLATSLFAIPFASMSQDQPPPELKALQATFQEQQEKLTSAYTARLKSLRAGFTKSQDLYEAALVYEEIKRAESKLPAKPAPRPEGLITFPIGDVEIVSAAWGVRSSVVDVTKKVVETLEQGEKVAVTYTNLGDPRAYSNKDIVVTYIHQGELKIIGVGAGKSLTYEQLVTPPAAK